MKLRGLYNFNKLNDFMITASNLGNPLGFISYKEVVYKVLRIPWYKWRVFRGKW